MTEAAGPDVTSGWIELVRVHLSLRPALAVQDIYKLFYQGVLGPEHLIADPAQFAARLKGEWDNLAHLPPGTGEDEPLTEPVRPDGALLRLNLRPYRASGGSLEALVPACLTASGKNFGSRADLRSLWLAFQRAVQRGEFPGLASSEVEAFTRWLEQNEYPAVHHSPRYRDAYFPAYRLVRRSL